MTVWILLTEFCPVRVYDETTLGPVLARVLDDPLVGMLDIGSTLDEVRIKGGVHEVPDLYERERHDIWAVLRRSDPFSELGVDVVLHRVGIDGASQGGITAEAGARLLHVAL